MVAFEFGPPKKLLCVCACVCAAQVLRQASDAAVLLTHPSETAADAAAIIAAAVAWCMRWAQLVVLLPI